MRKYIYLYKSQILYIIFGGLSTIINIVLYMFLYNILNASNVLSTIIAWIASVLFSYITNRIWVFESDRRNFKDVVKEITSFFICRISTGIIDLIIMFVTVDMLSYNNFLMKLISNTIVIILNYIGSKLIVFR